MQNNTENLRTRNPEGGEARPEGRHTAQDAAPRAAYDEARNRPEGRISPEEQRWRAAAEDPDRLKRHIKIQYVMTGIWCALTIVWGACIASKLHSFRWVDAIVLLAGFANLGIGIVNNRRLLAGKKPW